MTKIATATAVMRLFEHGRGSGGSSSSGRCTVTGGCAATRARGSWARCARRPRWHLGGSGSGFFTVMRLYPRRDAGVVLMGNTTRYDHDALLGPISAATATSGRP